MALSISQWAEMSWWGTFVRESTMGFAIASVFLLFGLTLLLGGIFLMSLRLFGLILTDRSVSQVGRDFRKWTLAGLVLALVSGPTMWAATAMRYYDSPAFWLEQQILAVAIVFHFSLWEWVIRKDDAPAVLRAFTGALALFLWFGVGVMGRAIGFF
ncbi:MAG TPA: DUF6644 family protein [Vicinamibacterales bacterium]|jgi:hypothetical protein|nr:DUF6644 family protein [Vicinamibacterales bacterium]